MHSGAGINAGTVRLLGSVALLRGDDENAPPGRRLAALLALLALSPGRIVMPHQLIKELWPETAPVEPIAALHSQVARLRRFLGPGLLLRESTGYRLAVPPLTVDVQSFERQVTIGMAALAVGGHETALMALRAGLAHWSGEPLGDLADLGDYPFAIRTAERLSEQRLAATAAAIEAEITLGGHVNVLGQLAELTTRHPLREDLWALRLLALYRSGRAADALSAHRRARDLLDSEVGLDPGPQLQQLERAILQHDPRLHAGFPVAATTVSTPARP